MPKLKPIMNRVLVTPIDIVKSKEIYIPEEFKDPLAKSVEGARICRRCKVLEVGGGGYSFDPGGEIRRIPLSELKVGDTVICYNIAPVVLEKGQLLHYPEYKDEEGRQLPLFIITDMDCLLVERDEK